MAEIKPFKGTFYNQSKINLGNVVAPPYDVINEEYQNKLYEKSDENIVRLILGREADRYNSAKLFLDKWISENILIKDSQESIYLLSQSFKNLKGNLITRSGIIALCKLEEFDKKIILPHEKTLSKPKEDRFNLISKTKTNFDQIFGIYEDETLTAEKIYQNYFSQTPFIEVEFENVVNKIWKITNQNEIQILTQLVKNKKVYIADGHHRYETALDYRNYQKENKSNSFDSEFVTMFFTNLSDNNLVVFPTHRVIHSLSDFNWDSLQYKLSDHFKINICKSIVELEEKLEEKGSFSLGIIVSSIEKYFIIKLKDISKIDTILSKNLPNELKSLDITLLHNYILEKLLGIDIAAQEKKIYIKYIQNVYECENKILTGDSQIAFIMNPTTINQLKSVANIGFTMPQKSTFFYPKLISGLVLRILEN
ncbi:MAG: DUF1015 domain-containing protein [Bacteroidetes bacterium]|nr:DUF1015 domain-containing protein [Bacteroidota bacterium]